MSHSRIFKVQRDFKEEFDPIIEYEFYDNGFLDEDHDYVSSIADYDEDEPAAYDAACKDDYEWLVEGYNFMGIDKRADGHYYLTIYRDALREYLDRQDADFQKLMQLPRKKRPEYRMDYYINGNKYGFYIYEDDSYNTIDCWLKDVEKYYPFDNMGQIVFRLEGVLDYHC